MEAELQSHIAFHLTGKRPDGGLESIAELSLRPALMAHYRDLTALRHDYPVVLVTDAAPEASVQSLTAVFDEVAAKLEIDPEPERTTLHLRRLEREIRAAVAAGESDTLGALWDAAAARLTAAGDDPALEDSLLRGRAVLGVDGEVVDCDATLPQRFIVHVWRAVEAARARRFRAEVGGLMARLSDVLRADFALSKQGRTPDHLRASMANAFATEIDFGALSGVLSTVSARAPAPEGRLKRVREVLAVLESQRFVSLEGVSAVASPPADLYEYLFDSPAEALEAYRTRLPEVVRLVRAIGIARLELRSDYVPERHDPFFREFGPQMLGDSDLAKFPGYLVRVSGAELQQRGCSELMELLGAGLPVKFVVHTDDIIEPSSIGDGRVAFHAGTTQLAKMALGLHDVFVMQTVGSHMFAVREQLAAGLSGFGPGLVTVFSGASPAAGGISPYLVGAAAVESRAFPMFWYDPTAGKDWASRFSLASNPQPEADWPLHELRYEDDAHQRAAMRLGFTLVDFIACDSRYAAHFARVPGGSRWETDLVPVIEAIEAEDARVVPRTAPYVSLVDDQNRMHRVIIDQKLMRAARRCLGQWRSLQELGGIHNSYAQALLERERAAWDAAQQALGAVMSAEKVATPAAEATPAAPAAAGSAAAAAAAPAEVAQERAPGEAYIETMRCSSCDECTTINKKMFAYDENKQAYIADIKAGTYRQLVEAAESCQVSIIHPGKPVNPSEPGLEELIARAAPFQ